MAIPIQEGPLEHGVLGTNDEAKSAGRHARRAADRAAAREGLADARKPDRRIPQRGRRGDTSRHENQPG
ncbi:MAG: hypothetical protein FJW23_09030 [Acidimicrobiia bacterium]|nr:hypothetical protein [Acidimicrobiia bacterium]